MIKSILEWDSFNIVNFDANKNPVGIKIIVKNKNL